MSKPTKKTKQTPVLELTEKDILKSIQRVVNYLQDEAKHYEECSEKDKKDHIFLDVLVLSMFLEKQRT